MAKRISQQLVSVEYNNYPKVRISQFLLMVEYNNETTQESTGRIYGPAAQTM